MTQQELVVRMSIGIMLATRFAGDIFLEAF